MPIRSTRSLESGLESKAPSPTRHASVIPEGWSASYPHIGSRPVSAIKAVDLLAVLRRVEARGNIETTHRVRSLCGRVFRCAVATGRTERNVSSDLRGALTPLEVKNRAAITAVGELIHPH